MSPDVLNHALFTAINATNAGPGTIAALEALAEVPIWLIPLLLAGVWLLGGHRDRQSAVAAAFAGCLSMLVAHVASVLVDRPRPFMVGLAPNLLGHADDSSFPSDHATLFFAMAVAFGRRPLPDMPGLGWLLACLGLAVGLARVALGIHFPSDVLGAIAIGSATAVAADVGLRRPVVVLFGLGERVRSGVGPLVARDRRRLAEQTHARPPH